MQTELRTITTYHPHLHVTTVSGDGTILDEAVFTSAHVAASYVDLKHAVTGARVFRSRCFHRCEMYAGN